MTATHPTAVDPTDTAPAWIEGAVIYGIIPPAFGDPAFQKIGERLDDLADLGVDALWLSPIQASPPGDFGYAVTDYVTPNPRYGTPDDLKDLVRQAHARNLRVLLDVVPNHTSDQHPWFQDAVQHGRASPYWDYYDRDDAGNPTHYFHWSHLPNLNFDRPEVRRTIQGAFNHWVEAYDVDGFRVDACWGIQRRRPDFWPAWRRELQQIKPDLLLLAEAGARDPYWITHGFDAAYDWTDELGHWAWEKVFTGDSPIPAALKAALTNEGRGFHPDSRIMRFLNNNDTGPRFLTRYGIDCYRAALVLLLTLPGLPCVYTGDEYGAEFEPYNTTWPIDLTDRHHLRPATKTLIALRHAEASLRSREIAYLETSRPDVFAFLRWHGANQEPILVAINFSASDLTTDIPLPPRFVHLATAPLTDLLDPGPSPAASTDTLAISVPAWSARVLSARPGG